MYICFIISIVIYHSLLFLASRNYYKFYYIITVYLFYIYLHLKLDLEAKHYHVIKNPETTLKKDSIYLFFQNNIY